MQLIIFGPPGAGKGTLAKRMVEHCGVVHISSGDIFRKAISDKTDLGQKVRHYLDDGKLVPDTLTIEMVERRLREPDCKKGFLLDGFPRNLGQAQALAKFGDAEGKPIDAAVEIKVDARTVIERLTSRRTCSACGAVYNVISMPSRVEGVCDSCGGSLVQRSDDTEDTVATRLDVYRKKTEPLIEFYRERSLLHSVPGDESPDLVWAGVKKVLGEVAAPSHAAKKVS